MENIRNKRKDAKLTEGYFQDFILFFQKKLLLEMTDNTGTFDFQILDNVR